MGVCETLLPFPESPLSKRQRLRTCTQTAPTAPLGALQLLVPTAPPPKAKPLPKLPPEPFKGGCAPRAARTPSPLPAPSRQ